MEVISNMAVNSKLLIKQVTCFVSGNQFRILEKFAPHLMQKFQGVDPGEIHVDVNLITGSDGHVGSETHNGGKQPVIVAITIVHQNINFKCICKARNAQIDRAVLEVFQRINELPEAQRSSKFKLPSYLIVNP